MSASLNCVSLYTVMDNILYYNNLRWAYVRPRLKQICKTA